MMEDLADELVGRLRADRSTDLTRSSMRMAVQVAARVIGLTDSSVSGMSRRLGAFFGGNPLVAIGRSPTAVRRALLAGARTAHFYVRDVKPAIRARRRQPREDIVSQLIELGFTDVEILTECITYAAAGMATTRELISAAGWHLIDDPDLWLATAPGTSSDGAACWRSCSGSSPWSASSAGARPARSRLAGPDGPIDDRRRCAVDLRLRVVNADPAVVGDDGARVCPGRSLPLVGAPGGDELRGRPSPLPRRAARGHGE